jgi:hypothetical protein
MRAALLMGGPQDGQLVITEPDLREYRVYENLPGAYRLETLRLGSCDTEVDLWLWETMEVEEARWRVYRMVLEQVGAYET